MTSKNSLKTNLLKYEKSAADKKADKSGAKKAGVSVKKYEKSAADKKADLAAAKKMTRKK